MQSILKEARQVLEQERFDLASTLVSQALASADTPAARLILLELLAQAQAGLHDDTAAAQTWQQAYDQAVTPADKARLFERAHHAYWYLRDSPALLQLAQSQLPHVRNAQERAACLLIAGEALLHLRQYREARQRYLEPAVALSGVAAETRVYLWHDLAQCYFAEQAFPAATAAFRRAAELALGRRFAHHTAHPFTSHAPLHHLRNAAYFYTGVIHLISHQPHQAVQALQMLQPPLTANGTLNRALFLSLAHRRLHQPEAAERALQPLARSSEVPETLRGPYAVVCAGIANLRQDAAVGRHLQVALDASLSPRTPWEPSWRVLLYQELGLALRRAGYRTAAIACYEEGLKATAQRTGNWYDPRLSAWLRGPSLLTALENLPVHAWSPVTQNAMVPLLQILAWLYAPAQNGVLADTALALALRLVETPEQQAALWLQRGWLTATRLTVHQHDMVSALPRAEIVLGLQTVCTSDINTALRQALRGVEALLQGDEVRALESFVEIPSVPEMPDSQPLCVAVWLWAHTKKGTLGQTLSTAPPPWQTAATLAAAFEILLPWMARPGTSATDAIAACLGPLLAHQGPVVIAALHLLCQPGVLPAVQQAALHIALAALLPHLADTAHADQLAELLGGRALLDSIDTLLAQLDQHAASIPGPPRRMPRRRKQHRRHTSSSGHRTPEIARVRHLIGLLEPASGREPELPETIRAWLLRYPHLGASAPEVVGALLGLLRQCPAAHETMQDILHRVPLSQRQRHALEMALQASTKAATPEEHPLAWEPLERWPLGDLLETLTCTGPQHIAPPGRAPTARVWYLLALVLTRVGLPTHAADCFYTCLHLYPEQPLAHFQLARLLHIQHQYHAALQHTEQAWNCLMAQSPQAQVVHIEILNQLLVLLGSTHQYDRMPVWMATIERLRADLKTTPLSATQRKRLREAEAEFALSQALYLATAPSIAQTTDILEQQLACLAQATATGTLFTQHTGLQRQAEILAHLQRFQDAEATYDRIIQQWPDDRRARLALSLLTATRHATENTAAADQALTEALSLAFARASTRPSSLTPQTALNWLHQASPQDPGYAEVTDVLTVYGGITGQRGELTRALEVLAPLYTLVTQPRQAYYLAVTYYARSQQAASVADQLQDCERALYYVHKALDSTSHRQRAGALLHELQAYYHRLTSAERQETAFMVYRRRVCALFTRYSVPFDVDEVDLAPDAPWLELHERVDLDETSGNPVTTIRLDFNLNAMSPEPQPSEQEMTRYAQHQREVQHLVETYGMAAFSWPRVVYKGHTAFDHLFPERLALNRDLIFIAHAERQALLRYAQLLPQTAPSLTTLLTAEAVPPIHALTAAARCAVTIPLLHKHLHTLALAAPSKALQRQISALQEAMPTPAQLKRFQTFPAFADTYTYFHAIAEAIRHRLDALRTSPSQRLDEPELAQRSTPHHRRRRHAKTRHPNESNRAAQSVIAP